MGWIAGFNCRSVLRVLVSVGPPVRSILNSIVEILFSVFERRALDLTLFVLT